MGWTLLELYSGYGMLGQDRGGGFPDPPEEKYFAETFCFLPLFSWMHQEQCDSNLIRQFLETLYALDSHQLAVPHLLVSGNQARKYAARLLALHFCEKQTALCNHFSLQELLEGSLQWKSYKRRWTPESGAGGSALQGVHPTGIQPARPVRKPDGTETFLLALSSSSTAQWTVPISCADAAQQ